MSPSMAILLVVWSIVATLAALYLAMDGSRRNLAAGMKEAENQDLRARISELNTELRKLREAADAPPAITSQSPGDELMPLRTGGQRTTKTALRSGSESPGTVAVVSGDSAERERITTAITAQGYEVVAAALADAERLVHELTTAALVLDLRDTQTATDAPALLESFASDSLAKEVPVFALIKSASEREHLLEDSHYTAAFVAPADPALFTSTLGAAIIRRRNRARRAEAARSLAAYGR